ncbi:MAG TPA: SRPBCC family protein [Pseudomonadales bacterium]|jgi:carbon monoxide dehydrogenase subunit G|nr:SRPBCC family protein [Pseudomonadales bacterium]
MAIEIRETFQVSAPIDQVWNFMKSPENLAGCMPGASLARIIDDRSFVGTVKLKVGAITASYDGTMTFIKLDDSARELTLLAEAKEKGGGTVSGTISANLLALPDGSTEVRCESSTDLTGRIVQVGRGMIEGVSKQVIQKFVTNVKSSLESVPAAAPAGEDASAGVATPAPGAAPSEPVARPPIAKEESINVLAVVWNVIWAAIRGFFRRLFGRA